MSDTILLKLISFDIEKPFSHEEILVGHVILRSMDMHYVNRSCSEIEGFWEMCCLSLWKELSDKKERNGNTLATKNQ